ANKFAPGLLDRYMARSAVSGQQTAEPANPGHPCNLWQPAVGDHGARGRFSAEAYEHSVQLWATTHRGWVALAGAALAAGAICASAARRRRHTHRLR
ncbi:MAG: hypothetical protein L0H63_07910, partial [Nitrococcus sp.]|nr:hypothetical protein [Nitrococcus sp.]